MKRLISYIIVALVATTALAGTPQEEIASLLRLSASNHTTYLDENLPQLTPAPAGYEAFFIDHYGRHGSRWLSSETTYQRPVDLLRHAKRQGLLTEQGERLLTTLQRVLESAHLRAGELSDKGAEQHQRIATRMYRNFPTVFAGNARVDARSTVVIRCILSMQNATMTLRSLNPQLRITTDASYHDMYYMGYGYGIDTLARHIPKSLNHITDAMYNNVPTERFMKQFFTLADSTITEGSTRFMRDVFDVAGSLQGHHEFDNLDLYHLFTGNEIFELWRIRNVMWYLQRANSPANGNRMPFIMSDLLRDFIDKADAAVASREHGAALRFGHESVVLPLACLMEIDNINLSTTDLDNLHLQWKSYEIIPKGCNIQMVFYTNGTDDVLVKVLYNEHEATLPVASDMAPYYRWSDLKAYYERKLSTPINWN